MHKTHKPRGLHCMNNREVFRLQGFVGTSELHFTLTLCLIVQLKPEKVEDFLVYTNYSFGYSALVSSSNAIYLLLILLFHRAF